MAQTAEEKRAYHREYARRWRANNPGRHAEISARSRKKRVERLRDEVYRAYGDECACLGCDVTNRNFFELDHVDGGGTAHRQSLGVNSRYLHFLKWIIDNDFPDTIQILCANCHLAKTRGVPCHDRRV